MSSHVWRMVSASLPCSVCAATTGCRTNLTGSHLLCRNTPSEHHYPKSAAWLHAGQLYPPRTEDAIWKNTTPVRSHACHDFGELHQTLVDAFDFDQRQRAAEALGLLPRCFDPYPIGYCKKRDALAIPAMEIGTPEIVGLRSRAFVNVSGPGHWSGEFRSTSGLLLPRELPREGDPILLCRGPCDAFAAAGRGLHAVSRWSAGIDDFHIETLKRHTAHLAAPTVIVCGDNEDPTLRSGCQGSDWAASRISHAMGHATVLRLQPPPQFKSLREWILSGTSGGRICADAWRANQEPWPKSKPDVGPRKTSAKKAAKRTRAKRPVKAGNQQAA
jgi:hypothetical protein